VQAPKVPAFITRPIRKLTGQPGQYTVTEDDRLRVDVVITGGGGGDGSSSLTNPQVFSDTAIVAPGTSGDLDAPTGGTLHGLTVGASVGCKWDILIDAVGVDVIFTMPGQSFAWRTPHPDFVAGATLKVRCTNLDQFETASAYCSFYWDGI
jgi:hypothetical protein